MNITYAPHTSDIIPYRVTWLNDPRVTRYLGVTSTTEEAQHEWFKRYEFENSKQFFTIFCDGEPVGVVGLTDINRETSSAKVFIMIGNPKLQGKGIGTQAMRYIIKYANEQMCLSALSLEVHKDNTPALMCYEAVGFQRFGEANEEDEIIMKQIP